MGRAALARPCFLVCAAGSALAATACNSILGIDPFVVYEGGAAGAASTSTSTSTTDTSSSGGGGSTGSGGTGGSTGGSGGAGGSTGGSGGTTQQMGKAIALDGVDDFVAFPDTSAYTPISGFTWELWFRGTSLPTGQTDGRAMTLFGALDGVSCEDIYLGFGSEKSPEGDLAFVVDGLGDCAARDPDPARFRPGGGFVDGQWYHVAAVADYSVGHTRLYLDGQLVADKQRSFTHIDRALKIHAGQWADGSQQIARFKGRIDELRVYGKVLSGATILVHYGGGAGTYGDAGEAGIVAGWHFDEGSGTKANAFAGGADGAAVNGATWGPGIVPLP